MYRSDNGLTLVITSSDCYCTIVSFDPNELGTPLLADKLPEAMLSSKHPTQQHTSPPRNCSSSPQRDELTPNRNGVHESAKQTDSANNQSSIHKSPSPPMNCSQSNSNSATGMDESETQSKPRRIRPTMISSIASPNGKISNRDGANQDQAVHSPRSVTVPGPLSPSTPSLHTQAPPSQTTPSVTKPDKDPSTASNSVSGCNSPVPGGGTTSNGLRTDQPMSTGTKSGTKDGETEAKVPHARRVNFTTLDTFTSLSPKTQTKTGVKRAENGGHVDKDTGIEDDCIVIE